MKQARMKNGYEYQSFIHIINIIARNILISIYDIWRTLNLQPVGVYFLEALFQKEEIGTLFVIVKEE